MNQAALQARSPYGAINDPDFSYLTKVGTEPH